MLSKSDKSFETVFKQFDKTSSGHLSKDEFKRAMTLFNLGLTEVEMQKVISKLGTNSDGSLNYQEFAKTVRDNSQFKNKMRSRASQKLVKLKN